MEINKIADNLCLYSSAGQAHTDELIWVVITVLYNICNLINQKVRCLYLNLS